MNYESFVNQQDWRNQAAGSDWIQAMH